MSFWSLSKQKTKVVTVFSAATVLLLLMGGAFMAGTKWLNAQGVCSVFRVSLGSEKIEQPRYFELNNHSPVAKMIIRTTNCAGKKIKFWINARTGDGSANNTVKPTSLTKEEGVVVEVDFNETVQALYRVGEEQCWDQRIEELSKYLASRPDRQAHISNYLQYYVADKLADQPEVLDEAKKILQGDLDSFKWERDSNLIPTLHIDAAAKDYLAKEFGRYDCNIEVFVDTSPLLDTPFGQSPHYSNPGESLRYMCSVEYQTIGNDAVPVQKHKNCYAEWETITGAKAGETLNNSFGKCMAPDGSEIPGCYEPLAPLPGLPETIQFADPDGDGPQVAFDIGQYSLSLISILIGAVSLTAFIMLVYVGFMYTMSKKTGNIPGLAKATERLKDVLLGSAVLLCSYLVLKTINPDLLFLSPDIKEVGLESVVEIPKQTFTQVTGQKVLTPSEYDDMAKKIAGEVGIEYCALKTILEFESKALPNAIGCDENVRSSDIPSRVAFIESGVYYNGSPLPNGADIRDKKVVNTCGMDASKPGFGLDWRFSKGIGMTQTTMFPNTYFKPIYKSETKKDARLWNLRTQELVYKPFPTSTPYTLPQLLVPETNLRAGAELFKYFLNKCKGDIYGAYSGYASGNCSSKGFAHKAATEREIFYNQCKQTQ